MSFSTIRFQILFSSVAKACALFQRPWPFPVGSCEFFESSGEKSLHIMVEVRTPFRPVQRQQFSFGSFLGQGLLHCGSRDMRQLPISRFDHLGKLPGGTGRLK
jgi:hypothetical protein